MPAMPFWHCKIKLLFVKSFSFSPLCSLSCFAHARIQTDRQAVAERARSAIVRLEWLNALAFNDNHFIFASLCDAVSFAFFSLFGSFLSLLFAIKEKEMNIPITYIMFIVKLDYGYCIKKFKVIRI